jgi:hypothetical protein
MIDLELADTDMKKPLGSLRGRIKKYSKREGDTNRKKRYYNTSPTIL